MKFPSFKKKYKATFHMKSGECLHVICEDVKITKDSNNDLTSFSITGMKDVGDAFYIRLDAISAITVK